MSSLSNEGTLVENDECSKDEKIVELQHELSSVIRQSAEDQDLIRELRDKNKELENVIHITLYELFTLLFIP